MPDIKGVRKSVIRPGNGIPLELFTGSKVTFHFKTITLDESRTVIDDSRQMGEPFELLYGRQFKLDIWEQVIPEMTVNELSSFACDKELVLSYPLVSKSIRDHIKKKKDPGAEIVDGSRCCASSSGYGYADLDKLSTDRLGLVFEIELLKVEKHGEYKSEVWQMTPEEKLAALPGYKLEGNKYYQERKYSKAADKYAVALGCIEQLLLKEKPGEPEFKALELKKLPFLLNYSQCKLCLGEYYEAAEHLSTVMEIDPNNVKAYYRRGKANRKLWKMEESRSDFSKATELDPTLQGAVNKELQLIDEIQKDHYQEMKAKYQGKGMFA
ncbi:AH receptor-interacting protein [Trichoplax sp. H2]|uniref:AIP/AIPL N-terminal FKBP-type PPIase domain-containing protein n=1 Tax=Trichoplax adhaerens TaxID=10228 RepID=B3S4E0_TRIAD|nr:hypothetical protein TRIADDRAFT_59051 [Trichoplax adhaerens]EDV22444.1 hypothetical protein TRIADDRAFT_59051 [Trichoplax adhaerens]RDD41131.1 AH receptor-interacting protein [Trichoplax sp. H2]|eukprot:XP_002114988.1 hypothetical protein TRIADDRAFT_59051 [Trichoplax adhaerens]